MFGSNENFKICFRDVLTFRMHLIRLAHSLGEVNIVFDINYCLNFTQTLETGDELKSFQKCNDTALAIRVNNVALPLT